MSADSEVLVEIRKELDSLRIEMRLHNDFRMKLFRANILHKFVDKIAESQNLTSESSTNKDAHSSQTKRMQLAAKINRRRFIKTTKLPAKCYILIQDYEKCVRERNVAAHETGNDMARLLMTQAYHEQNEYHKWRLIFPYVYGKTIEQMAAEGSSESRSNKETIWTADI